MLEAAGLPVGVVTAINGFTRLRAAVKGIAGHAGTVPMGMRRDALAAAAECVLAVERIAAAEPDLVGTVGRLEALPGAINVIPGEARFTIDVRSPRDGQRQRAVAAIRSELQRRLRAARRERRVARSCRTARRRSARRGSWSSSRPRSAAHGLPAQALPSGAGHDGMAHERHRRHLHALRALREGHQPQSRRKRSRSPMRRLRRAFCCASSKSSHPLTREERQPRQHTETDTFMPAVRTGISRFLATRREEQARFLAELVKSSLRQSARRLRAARRARSRAARGARLQGRAPSGARRGSRQRTAWEASSTSWCGSASATGRSSPQRARRRRAARARLDGGPVRRRDPRRRDVRPRRGGVEVGFRDLRLCAPRVEGERRAARGRHRAAFHLRRGSRAASSGPNGCSRTG